MMRAKKLPLSPNLPPRVGGHTGKEEMMELVLDMSNGLQAMEAYIAQWDEADHEQVEVSKAASMRTARVATCS